MIEGGVVLVTDKYKRLPFFYSAGNNTFIPKPLVRDNLDNIRLQLEFCRFITRYYNSLKDNIEVLNVGEFDYLFNRMFEVGKRDEFNVYAILNSVIYNKLCKVNDLYSYIDFLLAFHNSPFRYKVGNSYMVVPLSFIDKVDDSVVKSLPRDLSVIGGKRAVSVVKKCFNNIFDPENPAGRVYYPNLVLVYPMLRYSLIITTRGVDVGGVLLEFDEFGDGVYSLNVVDFWCGGVKLVDNDIGDDVNYIHFCDRDCVIIGGERFDFDTLEFNNEFVIVNGSERVRLKKSLGLSGVRIVSY